MKPASATTSGAWRSMRSASAVVEGARAIGERAVVDDLGGDAARAREREPARRRRGC